MSPSPTGGYKSNVYVAIRLPFLLYMYWSMCDQVLSRRCSLKGTCVTEFPIKKVSLREYECDQGHDTVFPMESVPLLEDAFDRGHDSVFPMECVPLREYECDWGHDSVFLRKLLPY